ncbi:hypothetical protein [Salininema proteolyticum]|uniref:PEGA domain-containing protein n=1 Tax=Salininema proteolyticum TaxID=1607685 RepID=A0ABV8TV35_9ACTN
MREADITRHPLSPHHVTVGTEDPGVQRGWSLLHVHLNRGTRIWIDESTRRAATGPLPTAPLLLVDDEPVAVGEGEAWIRLPVGRHRVSLQSGFFAGWWTVDARDGETVELTTKPGAMDQDTLDDLPLKPKKYEVHMGFFSLTVAAAVFGLMTFAVTLVAVAVPAFLVLQLFSPETWESIYPSTTARVLLALPTAAMVVWAYWDHYSGRAAARREDAAQNALAEQRLPSAQTAYEVPFAATSAPGGADSGILLDLRWDVLNKNTSEGNLIETPWVRSLTVGIDGVSVPATWGRWWIPLHRGEHRIDLSLPKRHSASGVSDPRKTWSKTVDVEEDAITRVRLAPRMRREEHGGLEHMAVERFDEDVRTYGADGRLDSFASLL